MQRHDDSTLPAVARAEGGFLVRVHVQPKASKTEWVGLHGGRLKLRVQAKPVEGEANEAVRRFVARTAGVAASQVDLVRGAAGRDKDILVRCEEGEFEVRSSKFEVGGKGR